MAQERLLVGWWRVPSPAAQGIREPLCAYDALIGGLQTEGTSAIALLDSRGYITYLGEAGASVLGRRAHECEGRSALRLLHPSQIRRGKKLFVTALRNPENPAPFELQCQHSDGSLRLLRGALSDRRADPQIGAVVCLFRNATFEKEVEEALLASHSLAQEFIRNSPLIITAVDLQGKVTLWNPEAERVFGWAKDEVIGQPCPTLLESEQEGLKVLWATVLRGERPPIIRLRARGRDNSELLLRVSLAPVRDAGGFLVGIMAISEDITDKDLFLGALRTKESELALVLEQIPAFVWRMDRELRLTSAMGSGLRSVGLSPQQLPGATLEHLRALIHLKGPIVESHRQALAGEYVAYEAFSEDGRVYVCRIQPEIHDGEICGVIGVAVDITHSKSVERELQQALLWREAVFEGSRDGVFVTDEHLRIVAVNAAACGLTGYLREELLQMTIPQLHNDADLQPYLIYHGRVMAGGEVLSLGRLRRRDGSLVSVEFNSRRLQLGEETYVHTAARDISERERAELELHESEERLRLIAQATNDALWEWDIVNHTAWWSDGFTRLFGHPAGLSAFERWESLIHPSDRSRIVRCILEFVYSNGHLWTDDYRLLRMDGTYADVVDRGWVVRDSAGKPLRMLGAVVDVTARRELERELLQAQKMEALGAMAGGVAHDFNNVLTGITVYAGLLKESLVPDSRQAKYAQVILDSASTGAGLCTQLLAFGSRQILSPTRFDLNSLIRQKVDLLRRVLRESITVIADVASTPLTVYMDPVQLEQILLNLVVNAGDAMPQGGTLTVSTSCSERDGHNPQLPNGGWALLKIRDTGTGMTRDIAARIFEPFFTTKPLGKGTGLGLPIVYGIVQQNGGTVTFASTPGEGTEFQVYLPLCRDDGDEVLSLSPSSLTNTPHKSAILLVEDEETVRAALSEYLSSRGHRIFAASTPEEALELARSLEVHFDLLVTDIVMPGMNGLQLLTELRAGQSDLKALVTSGYADAALSAEDLKRLGAQFLRKPFSVEQLGLAVTECLNT